MIRIVTRNDEIARVEHVVDLHVHRYEMPVDEVLIALQFGTVVSSDAHYLWDIAEAGHEFEPGDDAISRLILASLGKQPL